MNTSFRNVLFRMPVLLVGVFGFTTQIAQNWNEVQKIVPSDRSEGSEFGYSVDISDSIVVIGAKFDKNDSTLINPLTGAGAVYVYKYNSTGKLSFSQKLVASDRSTEDNFGVSVSISGDYILVGAQNEDHDVQGGNTITNSGSAYIFKRNNSNIWVQTQKVTAPSRGANDEFGISVSIDSNRALIGARYEDEDQTESNTITNTGSAYLFECDTNGIWSQVQKLVAIDRGADDDFGVSVSISGSYCVIGAYREDHDTLGLNHITNCGSAYIFKVDSMGDWISDKKITQNVRSSYSWFGLSVDISGDNIIIGAPWYNNYAGASYVFNCNQNGEWNQENKILPYDLNGSNMFGYSVSISNDHCIVGAYGEDSDEAGENLLTQAGAAFVYNKNNSTWNQEQKIVASDRSSMNWFASAVAISGDNIIIGAKFNDRDSLNLNHLSSAGSFYSYKNYKVFGNVYNDINNDCLSDTSEIGLMSIKAVISPGNIIIETNVQGFWNVDFLPAGNYTITVDTSGGWLPTCSASKTFTIVHPDSVTVVAPIGLINNNPCASPDISLNMPFIRPCFTDQKIYVQACNNYTGTGSITNGYVIVNLDSMITPTSASIPYTDLGNNLLQFDVGTLYPGQCVDFNISTTVSCNAILGQTLCLEANLYPEDSCVFDTIPELYIGGVSPCTTPWDKSSLNVEGTCQNDSICFVITNTGDFGGGDMSCYAPVRLYIDGQLISLDSIQLVGGGSISYCYSGDGRTWRLEADQHPLHPGNSHPNAVVELCGNPNNWTPDLVNIHPMDDADPIVDIYCGVVTGSYDPNDKTGFPTGITEEHDIRSNQQLEYMIRFQNTGTDTAFTVVIRDTLDTNFNIFSVQSGVSSHAYDFTMYGPRILQWTFNNILLPDSTTDEPGSHGFVMFKVDQQPNLPQGTKLYNNADIYFDYNPPIITNETVHTINDSIGLPSTPVNISVIDTICDLYSYKGLTYSQSGTYWQYTENPNGDSLITLNIEVRESTEYTFSQSECYSYTLNGNTYDSSNTYSQVFINSAGCDSTLTIDLTINSNTSSNLIESSCYNYLSPNGNIYSTTGIYIDTIPNSNGCDSIISIDLTILNSTNSNLSQIACESYSSPSGVIHTSSGIYIDSVVNINGCDSIITIDLTILNSSSTNLTRTSCNTFISPNGNIWNTSGIYNDTLTNSLGCDSIVTIDLTIYNSTNSSISETSCDTYQSPSGIVYNSSGIYVDTISNSNNCDSIITINLTINTVDTTVSQTGIVLESNNIGATYQWINCDSSSTLFGETNQSFTPTVNGNYAVQLTENGCIDTSTCYLINSVGLLESTFDSDLIVYPNPTDGLLQIELEESFGVIDIKVIDIDGQVVINRQFKNRNTLDLELSSLANGVYFVKLKADDKEAVLRVVKED